MALYFPGFVTAEMQPFQRFGSQRSKGQRRHLETAYPSYNAGSRPRDPFDGWSPAAKGLKAVEQKRHNSLTPVVTSTPEQNEEASCFLRNDPSCRARHRQRSGPRQVNNPQVWHRFLFQACCNHYPFKGNHKPAKLLVSIKPLRTRPAGFCIYAALLGVRGTPLLLLSSPSFRAI